MRFHLIFAAVLAGVFSGCSGSYKHSLSFNPAEPIRVAVLPFAQVDDSGGLVQADENYLIDDVGLVSSKLKLTPAQFVQNVVQSELAKTSLDVVAPALVEATLVHNGFATTGSNPVTLDLSKVFAADPRFICTRLISCDAVLYGKVLTWDRDYYGIQTINTVEVELKLISAHNGKVLFQTTAKDSDSRGITKGPTGFSNLVIEPIKGLDNSIITELASEVVEKGVAPLNLRTNQGGLSTAPPAIIAAAHNAETGRIPVGGKLTVIILGSPGQTATFSVGKRVTGIPLIERTPGQYVGEYIPLENDSFKNERVIVSLKDDAGRASQDPLPGPSISYR